MKVTFIQTGGTIDKDYPKTTGGWAFEFGTPAAHRILERLNPSFEYEILTACQKDSLELNAEDRQSIVQLINDQDSSKFVITHGTDTMKETASFIAEHIISKVIVITGAIRPDRFSNSDASINLGTAIGAVQLLPNGVYIAMHGLIKNYHDMERDLETGKFY